MNVTLRYGHLCHWFSDFGSPKNTILNMKSALPDISRNIRPSSHSRNSVKVNIFNDFFMLRYGHQMHRLTEAYLFQPKRFGLGAHVIRFGQSAWRKRTTWPPNPKRFGWNKYASSQVVSRLQHGSCIVRYTTSSVGVYTYRLCLVIAISSTDPASSREDN